MHDRCLLAHYERAEIGEDGDSDKKKRTRQISRRKRVSKGTLLELLSRDMYSMGSGQQGKMSSIPVFFTFASQ